MNNLGRILLLVGGLVLVLLIGVLIGRGREATPTSESANTTVQINTAAPPATPPTTALAPLPAPVEAPPPPVTIPKLEPDLQVQEDAAAVGMTTQEAGEPSVTDEASAPTSAAAAGAEEPIT